MAGLTISWLATAGRTLALARPGYPMHSPINEPSGILLLNCEPWQSHSHARLEPGRRYYHVVVGVPWLKRDR